MSKTTDLVAAALAQALATRRRSDSEFTARGLVHHSDAGSQYTALAFTEELAEAGIAGLQARLQERVRELRADTLADEQSVAQEIAKFAGRSDITEEVVRFRGHLEHWQALSDSPEPCGRKLDFLLQEMNREVNTAGSKAEGPAVSETIVALKAELEKMREQVQNVE